MAKSKTKLAKMEERRRSSVSRARQKAKEATQAQLHTLLAGGSALGIGFAENRNIQLPTIDAVDPSVLYPAITFAASFFIRDVQFKRILEGVTDGLIGVAAYKAGRYGFKQLFNYSPPVQTSGVLDTGDEIAWGEEIVETGEF